MKNKNDGKLINEPKLMKNKLTNMNNKKRQKMAENRKKKEI